MIFLGGKTWLFSDFFSGKQQKVSGEYYCWHGIGKSFLVYSKNFSLNPKELFYFFVFQDCDQVGRLLYVREKSCFWIEPKWGGVSRSAYLYPLLYFSSLPSSFIFATTTTSPQKAVVFPERKKKETWFSLLVRDFMLFCKWGHGKISIWAWITWTGNCPK